MDASLLSPQYIAGLFDGEGHFTVGQQKGVRSSRGNQFIARLGLTIREKYVVDALRDRYGGSVQTIRPKKNTHSVAYSWVASGRAVLAFLDEVEPYLLLKSRQATLIRELQERKNANTSFRPLTDEEWGRHREIREELMTLNTKGVGK